MSDRERAMVYAFIDEKIKADKKAEQQAKQNQTKRMPAHRRRR